MSGDDLESIEPAEAVEMWLDHQRSTRADSTIQTYSYRLSPFVEWCEQEEIDDLNQLGSRDVFRYESHRRAEDLTITTLNNQIGTLKLFLGFCERINAVEEGFPQKIEVPTPDDFSEMVSQEKLPASRAEEIREQLQRFSRASRRQAMFELLWHTGCRIGGLRALDLADLYFQEDDLERLRHRDDVDEEVLEVVELPFVFFQHRPDTDGTRLKNALESERPVGVTREVADRIQEYVTINRVPAKEHGRRPLFTTQKGDSARVSKSSIRREVYIMTQPCRFGDCPHDRDPERCEATEHGLEARCPSSRSPHPIRSGVITYLRDQGWPPEAVGERVDATPETIRLHYDLPDKIRRMQSRRQHVSATY
ncbi:tyrosine-type recombinase/integrase [Salinarchaeum laminariae]|uniref:tyrosine-type recombinase/integrase n=1 Tax=Salinarchaeum laminariae TaxID=869888 RepID=UPI0020BDDDF5|nr:site-specific integrase [Salinarchaeum laminariae]